MIAAWEHCLLRASLVSVWALAVGSGFVLLLAYKNTPGEAGDPPSRWSAVTPDGPDSPRPCLHMAVHPHCPCTHASIEELDRILTRCGKPVSTRVLFFQPRASSPDWVRTALWQRAVAIPGVEVVADPEGGWAKQLGMKTSGHVVLFSSEGQLLFSGGITASRGHEGDNAGARAVLALLMGAPAAPTQAPVFGCPLQGPTADGKECELCKP